MVILDSIAGSLRINGTGLSSLTGLGNLTFIGGGLEITNNSSLISLTGLDNLTSIGNDLYINNNFSLSTCEAEWMCGYLTNPSGSINISENANGCKSIIELSIACGGSIPCLPYGNYLFYSQTDIDHFPLAFPECIELEGNVTISGSPLCPSNISNLSGLSVLTTIGGDLNIGYNYNGNYIGNPLLINLTGLENLDSIRGSLLIRYNDTLNSFAALNNLTSIGGTFVINSNNALISLAGLENLNSTGGLVLLVTMH
ncbi:MAG: hypothetical protein IPH20_20515 [Bacteroidales bacterium]|nr:hypothetical protein [Bacteroidales bacterium]